MHQAAWQFHIRPHGLLQVRFHLTMPGRPLISI